MARYIAGFWQEARKYGRFWGAKGPIKALNRESGAESEPFTKASLPGF
jgi:hypothetical protein